MCAYQDVLYSWIMCFFTRTRTHISLDQMYIFRTYVLAPYVYLPGPMSRDHIYRTYVLGSYVYSPGLLSLGHIYTYQDLCPWDIWIFTRTYVLGPYVYLPGPMSLGHMNIYQDYVLGSYVYLPGPMSLGHMYTCQDLRCWEKTNTNKPTRRRNIGISMFIHLDM